jgi:anaerobic selenocysteine-containing dehydrogenase
MGLNRRQFLKWAGATGVGAVVFNGCRVPDHEIQVQSPVDLPEDLVTGRDNYYATVVQHSSGSEGLLVRVMEGRAKKIEGNPDYPMNTGKHGIRAEALLQEAYHPDRIPQPLARVAKGGPFRSIGWPDALERLAKILSNAAPGSVLLATSPVRGALADVIQRFSATYGAKQMGFESLDQTVLREATKQVFGTDALPDFDIANASYLMSFGADFLGTWVDPTHFSRGYGEFRQGPGKRGHLVHVDSRYSVTAAAADKWVFANPGSEGLLAMSMIHVIISEGLGDAAGAAALTGGRGSEIFSAFRPERIAQQVGLSVENIVSLAHAFVDPANSPALAIGGGASGAHTNGLFNLSAIFSLNYLAGTVNKTGGVKLNPEPLARQVNANPLREWKEELASMRSGDTKVLLVKDANLEYGLPLALDAPGALSNIETIVSFSSFLDETTEMADLILPGHTPLEEWGSDAPNPGPGYATLAFQQPAINRFRDTMGFGDVLLQTARTLGIGTAAPWQTMRDAVRESARKLHKSNRGSITKDDQPTFEEFWKRALERGGWWDMNAAYAGEAPKPKPLSSVMNTAKLSGDAEDYPFYLVPFEGQGILAGQLSHLPWAQAVPDPLSTAAWDTWVELNPKRAVAMNLKEDDIVIIESSTGKTIRAVVYFNPSTSPDVVAVPFGQGHRHFTSYASRRGANVLDIIAPEEDEDTGALAWAGTRARVVKTNKRRHVPKLEGIVEARQLPGEEIILVQRGSRA